MNKVNVERILKSDATETDVAVASQTTNWTRSKRIDYGSNFCISYRAKSSGTPNVDLYLEQTCFDPDAEGNAAATGQGVILDVTNGWAIPEGIGKLVTVGDKVWHHLPVSPVTLPWLRLKCIGGSGNPADVVIEFRMGKQENIGL